MNITYRQEDLPTIAKQVLSASNSKIILFYGAMGIGKTTLIKEMCKQLGASELAASPTFSIVNEYEATEGLIYHFDFYRIDDPNEALDLGVEDYLYSGNWIFIEWPEKISSLIPEDAQKLILEKNKDGSRTLRLVSVEN
jgi:tRNA threonylcarbamoyladenosine biosynthesis protein TsaE